MLISAACSNCKKRYKVDAKLGGRSLKCKACGGVVSVPQAQATAEPEMDDLTAGLAAAAEAEQKAPARPAPAPPRVAPRPAAPRRSAPPPSRESQSIGLDEPSQLAPPRSTPPRAPVSRYLQVSSSSEADVDSAGFLINNPYPNTALNLLDTWVPKLAVYLILALVLYPLGLAWYGALNAPPEFVNFGRLVGYSIGYCIFIGLAMLINLSITAIGVEIGAKIMKCRLPEQSWSRLLATYLFPAILTVCFLMLLGSGLQMVTSGRSATPTSAALVSLLTALGVFLTTSFFTFMFFFRLKILPAVVCYLFFILFYGLSCIANLIVFFIIGKVLSMVQLGGSGGP